MIGDVDNAVKEILKLSKEQNHMKGKHISVPAAEEADRALDPHSALRPILGPCPPLVEDFIGREDILTAMYRTHFDAAPSRRQTPIVTVLYGLGGSGKTQIALKFALKFKEKYVIFARLAALKLSRPEYRTLLSTLSTRHPRNPSRPIWRHLLDLNRMFKPMLSFYLPSKPAVGCS